MPQSPSLEALGPKVPGAVLGPGVLEGAVPDLHTAGRMLLPRWAAAIYDLSLLVHFITILISYGLAGSQAYGQLLGLRPALIVWPFVVVGSLIVSLLHGALRAIISALTFAKGSLLLLLVGLTAAIGAVVGEEAVSSVRYVMHPFLVSTVALGGSAYLIPFVMARSHNTPRDMWRLKVSIVAGLLTVWAVTMLWCFCVLMVVPQHEGEHSLEGAEAAGHISTVPLIDIINEEHPRFHFVATVIDVFTMISISVSFITIGTGFRGQLDGLSRHIGRGLPLWVLHLAGFGLVLLLAVANPDSFVLIIKRGTSLALNLGTGIYIPFMAMRARALIPGDTVVASPMGKGLARWYPFMLAFFFTAILWDFVEPVLLRVGIPY